MLWHSHRPLGERQLDVTRRWLPAPLSSIDRLTCLDPGEALKLSHVEFGAYAHLLGCLGEFVVPTMLTRARRLASEEHEAAAALSSAATAVSQHIGLFREVRSRVNAAVGFPLALLPEIRRVTDVVLGKHPAAVLLLTTCVHAVAEHHGLLRVQDDASLDAVARQILASYWQDAARPAQRVRLEAIRVFEDLPAVGRDDAIDDFVELVIGIEALLAVQARYDVENLQRYLRRPLARAEQSEVLDAVTDAKRHALLESGLTHSTFRELFGLVATRAQRERVEDALDIAMMTVA
ncbi:MAG TPA: hypothetical protein VN646_04960 [Candidatus Acidoferrum sp.]|jgi:hypothetical protein|nr:hypothetical protein [Candidatus Acidoferrum sp.]